MPGNAAGPTAVPDAYAPLLSAACPSCAVARLRRSPFMVAKYAFSLVLENLGIAIAARMLMMTTTIRSSISVKPLRRGRMMSLVWFVGRIQAGTRRDEPGRVQPDR